MATKQDFLNRIELLNEDFNWFNSKNRPATLEMIGEYERTYDLIFNGDVKDFLLSFGSVIIEVTEKIWARPNEGDIMPAWKFGYGFFVYGMSTDPNFPSWMSYEEKTLESEDSDEYKTLGQLFFKRSGNLYRAYINDDRITIEYDANDEDREQFEGNFYDFLIAEIDKLQSDYEQYIAE